MFADAKFRERSILNMKKEYEVPFCRVVAVENKDILTASDTTTYQSANKGTTGNFDSNYGGAYVSWNSKW